MVRRWQAKRVALAAVFGLVVSAGLAHPLSGQTQTLIWENVYANGAVPGPVTLGGTTVSINAGTPSGGTALANHNTVQHGQRGAHSGYYYFGFDGTAQGQLLRTALNFSRPVDSLTLDLLDIDLSSWHDSVTIRGYNGNTAFVPNITFAAGATPILVAPGEITATANHGNTSAGGNATLSFLQPLDSLVVVYYAGPRIAGDPAAQVLGFADLTWTLVRGDLNVSKSGPDSVQVGDTFTYVVTTTNNGPDRADSVVVTDTLPAGMTFISANRGGAHASGVVTWPGVTTLASGATQVDSVTVTSTVPGSTQNTAAAQTQFTTDSVPGNNTGTHTVVTTPVSDLDVLKTGPPTVLAGDTITYTVRVTNLGPSAATSVVIADTLPATGTFVSASNGGTEAGGLVTWPTVASMTTADTVTYTVTLVAPTAGSLDNVAVASSPVSDPTPSNNASSVSTTVTEQADLAIAKTGPATAMAADTLSYSIQVTNLGPSSASSVVITDTLPATGTFVSASSGGTEASGVVTWPTTGTMTPADTITYTVRFVAPTTGSLSNVAAVNSATGDPSFGNNTSTVSTTITEVADLHVVKTGPAIVDAADTITYAVRVTNLGPSNATGVIITDTLPASGTFVSASDGGTESGGVVTWPSVGSMTPADTVTYTVTLVAPPTGSLVNVAAAIAATSDPNTANNTSSVSTSVTEQADIDVSKTGPASVDAGDTITYTVQVTNGGPSNASSVSIRDTLPVSGTFVSASNGGSESSGVVTWPTVATMTPTDTVSYTVTFVAPATGSLTNRATATASTADPNSANNVSTVATSVTEQADLEVLKSGPAAANAGDTIVYSLRVTNLGPSDAAAVVISDTLPGAGTFVSATGGGVESAGVLTWPTLGSMTPADTVTYTVVYVAPATGTLVNIGAAASATADPTAGNNSSSVVTTVAELADLEVVKTGPAGVDASDTITYSVRVTNLGPSAAAGVIVTDTLPGAGTFVSASAGGVESAGVVTWPTITSMTPSDTVTYTVTVVAPPTGSLENIAAATSATTDPTEGNNRSSITTLVTDIADLRVTKTGPTGALSGDTLLYVVTATNLGPSTASSVVVTDTLPGAAVFVDATGGGSHSSGVVTWSLGALTSGMTVVDTVRIRTTTNTTYLNVVAGTTATSDSDPSNNDGSASGARVTTVVPPAASDLMVTKTAPASVNAGDTITYGVKVRNAGPDAAQSVVVTDTLPASGTFVSASAGGSRTAGVVTWPTVANLAANDSVQFTVTLVAPPTGTLVNVAAATSATADTVPGGERSSVTTTVVEQADVSVTKTGPATANAGDTIEYVITATNLGPSDAVDVVMADTVPTGLTFVSASRSGAFSTLRVTWPAVTIPVGGGIADTVRFTTAVAGSYRNIGFVLSSNTADPNTANDDGEHTVVVAGQADLELVKTGPASANAGDTITYSVRVTNLGPSDATAVTITDTLPPTGTFVAASNSASESGGIVTWPVIGTMTTSDTVTYTVTFVAPGTGSLDNVAAVTSAVTDPSLSNNNSAVSTSISERSDVEVLKSGPAGVNAGDTVAYTVTVTTLGPSDATSVVITDTLPATGTFVSASNGGTEAGGIVTWPTLATMTPSDTVSYTVRFVAPGTGTLTNLAAAVTATTDPALANNTASVVTTVAEQADVEVVKTGPAAVNAGDTITYSVRVTNLGVTDAASVVITDTLPATGTFLTASNAGSETGGVVTWPTIGTMTTADTVVYTVTFIAPASGTLINSAAATSATPDPTLPNNMSSVSTVVAEQSDIDVLKTGPATADAGDTVTYSIRVTTLGPSNAANVVVTDTLPGAGTFVSASNGGTATSGVVTWPTIGSMTPADTVTYMLSFVAPGAGTLNNVAAAVATTADPSLANNRSAVSTGVSTVADLEVVKVGPASIVAGDTITYSIRVTNLGVSDAASVVIADTLPGTGTFVSASNGGSELGGIVTWPTIGSMTPTDTVTYTLRFVAPGTGTLQNIATAASTTTDPVASNNSSTVSTTVSERADLEVLKTGPAAVNAADTVSYSVRVTNLGPTDAATVVITDTLPATGTFVSASDGGTVTSGVVTWPTIAMMTPADTVIYTVTFVAPTTGSVVNRAVASTSTADPNTANNSSSVSTTVAEMADVEVSKTGPAAANAGDTITYSIQVTNLGASNAANVITTDTLPATGVFVSASSGGAESSGVVTWPTVASMTTADTVTYTVTFVAPASGSLDNVAAATSSTPDPDSNNNRSSVGTAISTLADLEVLKTGPATINAADTIIYTIQVTNLGPSDAAGVVITDTLPTNGTFVSASNGGTQGSGIVTWPTVPSMTPSDTVVYTVVFVAPVTGALSNVAAATTSTSESTSANNRSAVGTTVTEVADLRVTKTGPVGAFIGDTIAYEITTTNVGPSVASGVTVTDTLPALIVFVDATGGGSHAAGVVSWSIASLSAGSSIVDTVRVVLTANATYVNVAAGSTSTFDPDLSNNNGSDPSARVTTNAPPSAADLAVVKAGPAGISASDTITYTVTVTNGGPNAAQNVVVTDTLPTMGTFVSATDGGVETGGVVTWPTIATMTVADTLSYTVRFVAPTSGSIANLAAATSPTTDTVPTNNTSTATTVVSALTDVAVVISAPATANAGDTIAYTVQVTNNGPSDAANVVVADTLPLTGTFISASNGGSETGGTVTWPTVGSMTPADTLTFTVTYRVPATGSVTHNASVSTSTTESSTANNTDPATTVVSEQADVDVVKTGPATANASDTIVYTVRVTNNGPSDAANVVITDTLPSSGTFVSASNGGVETGGVITWPTVVSITPSDTAIYTVTFVSPASGSITNITAATSATVDPVTTNNDGSGAARVVTAISDLTDLVATIVGQATANAGDTIVYTLTVTNNGPSDAANVVIADTLPATGSFVSASNAGVESGGTVTWPTIASMTPGDTVVYTVRYRVPASGAVTSTATAATPTTESTTANNIDAATTTITAQVDLDVLKTGPPAANAGDTITYAIQVTNLGPSNAASVVITDTLPATGTLLSASNGGVGVGGVITWPTIASVTPTDTINYTVTFVTPTSGSLTNTAAAESSTSDLTSANNTSSVVTTVASIADVAVSISGPAAANAGDTITYTVQATNNGPSDAANVVLADSLPPGGTFVGASNGGTESGGTVTWPTLPTMTPADTVTYTVTYILPPSGTVTSTATVATATTESTTANNSDAVSTAIAAQADVQIIKTGPANANASDTVVYTLTVTNGGPSTASNVVVSDTLPSTGVLVGASDGGVEASGVITWPSLPSVTIADTVVYTVTFVAPTSGAITNISAATSPTTDPIPTNNDGSGAGRVTTSIAAITDVAVDITGPAGATAGDTIVYTIRVTNNGPSDAVGVVIADSLPAIGTFVSASNGGTESGRTVTWPTVSTMTPADTITYTVTYVVPTTGTLSSTATVTTPTTESSTANNVDPISTVVAEQADLEILKTGPTSALAADTIVYTIRVVNLGPSSATNVIITDTLPATDTLAVSGQFVAASNGGTESGEVVTWPTIPTMLAGDTVSYTVTYQVPNAGPINNRVGVTSATPDPTPANNTDGHSVAITPRADVQTTKTGPATALVGDTITYALTTSNVGPNDAASVVLTDTLPAGATFVDATGGGTEAAGVVTWTLGTVSTLTSRVDTVRVQLTASGSYTNIAAATAATADSDPTNNDGSGAGRVTTTVGALTDLAVAIVAPATANAGDTINYTVTVTNNGPSDATSVVIADTLPSTGTFVSASNGGVEAGGTVTWPTVGTVTSADTIVYTVTYVVPASGSLTSTATVATPTTESNSTNNVAAAVTTVALQADLDVLKTGPANVIAGDTIVYTIRLTNLGPSNASTVILTDTLPLSGTFVSASNGGTEASGVVTWPTISSITPADTVSYNVTFISPLSGPLTNVAAVASPTADPNSANNRDTVLTSIGVVTAADVSVVKTGPAGVNTGDTITYGVKILNAGPDPAVNVVVTDTLPATGAFVSASNGGTESGGVVTWPTVVTLAANDSIEFSVLFVAPASGTLINVAAVTSATTDTVVGNERSSVSTSVTVPLTNLEVVKAGPAGVGPGDTIIYTVRLTNLGPDNATSVVVTDTLPATGTFLAASGGGVNNAGVVTWPTIATVAPSDTVTYTVTFEAPASGALTNIAAATTPTSDSDPSNNNGTAGGRVVTVVGSTPAADIAVVKTGPANAVAGDTIVYDVKVLNRGPNAATNVVVTDTLPASGAFVSASNGATQSAGVVTWPSIGTLAPNDSVLYTVAFQVPGSGTLVNVAAATTSTADTVPGNETSSVATTIGGTPAQADVRVTKSGPTVALPGDTLTYTIVVTNDGPATATSVVTVDQLPTGMTFVSASGGGSLSGSTVTWPVLGALASGSSFSYSLRATATGVGTFVNTALASTTSADANSTNNDGSTPASRVTTTIASDANLRVTKTGPGSAMPGDTIEYTVVVANAGPSSAANVALVDSLPAGLTFIAASGGGVFTDGVVRWPANASLPANGQITRTVRVVGWDVGVRTNVAAVSSTTPDQDPSDNRDTAVTAISATPDVAIEKSHSGSVVVGQRATYTLVVTNVGQGPTGGVITVVDTLPAGLTFVSGTGPGWAFANAGQVVTATRTQSMATNSATSLNLTVDVGPTAAPTVVNRAHVTTAGDGVPENDSDTDTASVGLVDLSIVKLADGEFNVGDTGTFTFTITNDGTAANTNAILVVDTLPAGLTYSSAGGAGWSASQMVGVVTAVFNGTLLPGASTTFSIDVLIGPLAAGAMINVATVSTDGDPGDRGTANFNVASGSDLVIEKTSSNAEVEVGDVVDYALKVSALGPSPIPDVSIIDELPPGFRYVPGTSRRDGQAVPDPTGGVGPDLGWYIGDLPAGASVTLAYRVQVGPEATTGDGINRATAESPTTGKRSNVALAAVRLRPGAFTSEGLILGKVYVECGCEIDGQNLEELGVPGVRVLLQDGTSAVTDAEGKYHFFGLSPRNWVVKVDVSSLPAGARLVPLTNRHGNDGSTVLVDLKSGELGRADFADGSQSIDVIDDVKSRRASGEVNTILLDPTAPEQVAAQRAVNQPVGTRLFRSIVSRSPNPLNNRNSALPAGAGDMAHLVDSTALTDTGAPAASVELERPSGLFTADGVTTVPYTVRVVGGAPVSSTVTVEATGGRWLTADADRAQPGMQIQLVEGEGEALLQAPDQDGRVEVRAHLANEQPTRDGLFFQARGHDVIAVGLVEARLDLRSMNLSDLLTGAQRNRFEDELTSLSLSSEEGRFTAGTRASIFAQGRVRDDVDLTLRLDTEEDARSRLFRDIRPDEFYPVYGDAAIQAFDAQSKGRFFGRLDRGASYLQYGDFNTAAAGYGQLGARELGRYGRTLNGLFQHSESERYSVNAFASRDRFVQVVDEIRGQGISGPYQLSRAEGLVNSERVELVTRDRNQPAVILGVESLERYTDYTIEPFSGRLIFKRPIPSVDPELNPVAIRVTYEVETGGDAFWIYGADGQLRANDRLELGGGYVRDDNGQASFDLASFNATVALDKNTFLVGEWARSDSADVAAGDARRLELRHGSKRFDARLFYLDSDTAFQNPSAAFGSGRNELGFRGYARIDDKTALFGEGLRTEDRRNGGVRRGWSAGAERAFGDWLRGRLGYRWADETAAPASTGTAETAGATPNETHAVSARLTGRLFSDGSVFGEFEQDVSESSQRRLAVGGDYRLLGRARMYGRHEFITSLAGPYALNTQQERNTTVFGIAADVLPGQSVFSEYRMRDAVAGREAQAAVGLRNRWEVREGVRLSTSFERLAPISGDGSGATAVTGAVDYTANPLWRGSARAEYRAADSGNNLFGSVGYARKLSRDWTFLGNSVFSTVVDGDRAFERSRLGFAYRQTDTNRWNALARYEHRYDRNPDLSQTETLKKAHVFAGHLNYQPNLDLILRGQWASKWASERSGGFDTNTQAHLAGARATLDVTDRWDVGAIGRVLMAGAIESAQWGLGGEVGVLLKDDLRLSAGYNVFGFDDGDLAATDQTDHGFYVQIGFKFDEGLFWGRRAGANKPAGVPIQRQRPLPVYQPNREVRQTGIAPLARDTLLSVSSRITDEVIAEDLLLIDQWMNRAAAAADTGTAQGRYGVARAIALAGIAKVEYSDNDRTEFTASLVREVKRTVLALEASAEPVLPEPKLSGTTRVAEDLWALVRQAKDSETFSCVADRVARLEATLFWAGNEELTCSIDDPRPHLDRARALAATLRTDMRMCRGAEPTRVDPVRPDVATTAPALIVPNVVHFAYDRSDLDARSNAVLDSIADVLVSNPTVRIAVYGHTDVRGSQQYNRALGARRAGSVIDYLASRGVTEERMRTLSRGEAETYRAGNDEHDHALNRRVEVRFLTPDGVLIRTRRQERDLKPRERARGERDGA